MSFFILITGAFAVIYFIKQLRISKIKKKRKDWIQWGLGVDCCCFYSKTFTVESECISINGYQEVALEKVPIRYSLVKKVNWWGKRKVYAQAVIYGDYNDSNNFQIIMDNIPIGENYQIEVYNGFNMSFGEFQVEKF